MRKITILLSLLIFCGLFIIVGASGSKDRYQKEESYSLRCNYNYLYEEDAEMNVYLYSNIENPSFSYLNNNTYFLEDYDGYFVREVTPLGIEQSFVDDYYRFKVTLKLPKSTSIMVEDLYFVSSNSYHEDWFNIGSLNVLTDTYIETAQYNQLKTEIVDNHLNSVTMLFDVAPKIKSVISSEALNITYETLDNKIKFNIDSINLTYEMYLVVETVDGIIKINNTIFNNASFKFNENRYYLSIMIRSDLEW